jgi:hypothetical protein
MHMKKILWKSVVMITSLIFFMTPPFHSYALIPPLLSWGGYPVITPIPCTCSASLWSWFAPLYLSSVPMTGPMVYVPYATVPFPNYHARSTSFRCISCWCSSVLDVCGCHLFPSLFNWCHGFCWCWFAWW